MIITVQNGASYVLAFCRVLMHRIILNQSNDDLWDVFLQHLAVAKLVLKTH